MMVVRGKLAGANGVWRKVRTVFAREQGLAAQHLSKDTADAPDINRLCILLEGEHDLGSTVPSSGNVFGHETRVVICRGGRASKTEIADFEITVSIQEEVGRLEVSVQNVGGVHSFQCTKGLVDEVLTVVVRKILSTDDTMHVSLHELL